MSSGMLYRESKQVPDGFFQSLPNRVRYSMLQNVVDIRNETGSVTMMGDPSGPIIRDWCDDNCAHRYCYSSDSQVVMFESKTDMVLFLTARPQKAK
jgi:hypothetical protein